MISRSQFGVLFVILVCVRINSCVGQANHCSFLLTLLFFLLTSLYGISLVLRSVCPEQNVMTALFYCPDVYNQFRCGSKYTNSQKCFLLHLIQYVLTLFTTSVPSSSLVIYGNKSLCCFRCFTIFAPYQYSAELLRVKGTNMCLSQTSFAFLHSNTQTCPKLMALVKGIN